MSIRKQSIYSSLLVYMGVGVGALNTYFFVRNGSFSAEQYALTRLFFDIGNNIYVLSCLGVIAVLYKFYPYYKDNLPENKNDLLGRSLAMVSIGFVLTCLLGFVFEPLVIRKFSGNAPILVNYYQWIFVFACGLLYYSVLEGYMWALQQTVLTNFLRETGMRLITFILIVLYLFHWIDFHLFIVFFSFLYVVLAATLAIFLYKRGMLKLVLTPSVATRKYKKKMLGMQALIYGGTVITTIGQTIAGITIASLKGMEQTAIFSLALYASNLIQIPQRSIQSIATGVLVRAWKDKNFPEINRIYQRSCINMLLLAIIIFGNVWLNAADGLQVFDIQEDYALGIRAMFVLGILRIIDAGTGLNGTLIATSNFWKFEFLSGAILLFLLIPLNLFFVRKYGFLGSAYAELIAFTAYNIIRFEYIRRRFNMQPFTYKTIYTILAGSLAFAGVYFLLNSGHGWSAMFLRSILFSSLMLTAIFLLKLTPDAFQLWDIFKHKWQHLKKRKSE